MICNSRRTIFYIYNTAFCKTVLFHQLLHNPIIGMGIHSDIPGNIFTVIRNTLKQSMHLSIPGKPVDCKIWFIIQPVAVFNMFICRVCTFKQCTYPICVGFPDCIIQSCAYLQIFIICSKSFELASLIFIMSFLYFILFSSLNIARNDFYKNGTM